MDSILNNKIQPSDRKWIAAFIIKKWGSEKIVCLQREFFPHELDGFIVKNDDEPIGLITYQISKKDCEIITLNSEVPGLGIGVQLIDCVRNDAIEKNCTRLFLFTTNDNISAIGFYLKVGFRLVKIHLDKVAVDRVLKPEIPEIGEFGIPIRDYLELEMDL